MSDLHKGVFRSIDEVDELIDTIEQLEADLSNERARGIHSCGPNCQRLECRQRREIEQLEAQVAKYQNAFDRMEDAFAVMKEMTRKPPEDKK